jgi:histone acetyltransferase (RNA polymerase elongator complex component)
MSKVKENEFWATNISNMNVSLRDLGITIPSKKSVNLLNSKHYSFNKEQLELSAATGSLFAKKDKILIRQTAPEIIIAPGIQISKLPRFIAQNMARTKIVVEEIKYEELAISESEEEFADEMTKD